MPTIDEIQAWRGRDAAASDGDKIGKIEDVYLDAATGQPGWLTVAGGLFGTKVSFVPADDARLEGDTVRFARDRNTIEAAPRIDLDGQLSVDEERALYDHYGVDWGNWPSGEPAAHSVDAESPRDKRARLQRVDLQIGVGNPARNLGPPQ